MGGRRGSTYPQTFLLAVYKFMSVAECPHYTLSTASCSIVSQYASWVERGERDRDGNAASVNGHLSTVCE